MGRHPAKVAKPDGAVCPVLIRLRRHFCSGVNDVKGHERTHAPQQRGSLFDHFVGGCEKRWRDGKAECPRGLKVDGQFELRR